MWRARSNAHLGGDEGSPLASDAGCCGRGEGNGELSAVLLAASAASGSTTALTAAGVARRGACLPPSLAGAVLDSGDGFSMSSMDCIERRKYCAELMPGVSTSSSSIILVAL
jgi:hypothetical protein